MNINRFSKLLKNVDIVKFDIDIQGKIYSITLDKKYIENLMLETFFEDRQSETLDKAFIRGVYLGSGSINNPENKYHLEIKLKDEALADKIINKLKIYQISVKKLMTNIYIKDSEEISKFLAFIGATNSVLKFEEIRVKREMNNKINRLVNCKTANLSKTINASIEQINAIKKLKETEKFNKLDEGLKELAELRLEYPDKSLIDLGKMLNKPIGKSGVNYRMKKIIELAK